MPPQDERIKELEAKLAEAQLRASVLTDESLQKFLSCEAQLTEAQAEIERLRGALKMIYDKLPDEFALEYENWKFIKAALAEGKEEK